ncbi:pilus assembly protein TadG-related protein [Sphingomonas koreensis]
MRALRDLLGNEGGAVAPIVAVALFGLVGAAGLAFDYARLAGLDTELQSAADQAALAAASQLDGLSGAQSRATSAAQALIVNRALFANDGVDRTVTVPTIAFYSVFSDATRTAATGDADSHFVQVTVGARTARYALTPIVGALNSGPISASAAAGIGTAICNVPPVMVCNPAEPLNNADELLGFSPAVGVGLRLITGNADAPGNFGWLESNSGNGASELAAALGYNKPPGNCSPLTGVTTKTGMSASVLSALNTRFDVFANGNQTCPSQGGGTCSPSSNSRKDLVCTSNNGTSCSNDSWGESSQPYRPASATALPADGSADPDIMGYPRDLCHAVSAAGQGCGTMGTGSWDRDAYFRVNYKLSGSGAWTGATGLSASASRYDVYKWEMTHTAITVGGQSYGISVAQGLGGGNGNGNGNGAQPTGFGHPATGRAGLTPGTEGDRRRISLAVLNCGALTLHGKSTNVPVAKWLDVFLVEPSFTRKSGNVSYTDSKEVYVEVIGETLAGANGVNQAQVVRRDVPYLLQ